MKYKKLHLSILLILGLEYAHLQAQETVVTAGGSASGSGGSTSYTIGQVVYTTNTGASGSLAQGIQQPYEISVISGIEQAKNISLQCSAYPNPSTDYVMLSIESLKTEKYAYQLLDINGKLIETKKIEGDKTRIVLINLAPSTYFLKVIENKKEIKTFKIIKN